MNTILLTMRYLIRLILSSALLISCTKEFTPPENTEAEANLLAIIAPTENPEHRSGEVVAEFLSSNSVFTVASSTLSNVAFPVTFVSTSQNNDELVWIFEGSTSSPTTVRGGVNSPTTTALRVYYQNLGKFDVVHGAANQTSFDIVRKKDYVSYEFEDNLTIDPNNDDSWEVTSEVPNGWIAPSDAFSYSACEESLVAYHSITLPATSTLDKNANHVLTKSFRDFGTEPKNLTFEYKIDFISLPTVEDTNTKISLSYNPVIALSEDLDPVSSDPYELWSDVTYDITNFRRIVIPLPNLSDFDLIFTKYPSTINSNDVQLHPFSVCIRDIRIVASE